MKLEMRNAPLKVRWNIFTATWVLKVLWVRTFVLVMDESFRQTVQDSMAKYPELTQGETPKIVIR